MMISRTRHAVRAITLLLVASILTTCGDDSSSSKEDGGVFGELADALQSAEDDFLTANAEIFASAEYLQPYIAGLLNLNPGGSTGRPVRQSCLPAGIGGRTYTINGTPFTSVEDTLVPDHTVRFRLFRLSPAGQPLLNHDIGYIDCGCSDTAGAITETHVFSGAMNIASMTYAPIGSEPGSFTGVLRSADGISTVTYRGSVGLGDLLLVILQIADTIEAVYRVPRLGEDRVLNYWGLVHSENSTWRQDGRVRVDSSEQILTGYATYTDSLVRISACIQGGTLASPEFSPSRSDCADVEHLTIALTEDQLQAMSDSYRSIRNFWLTTGNLVEVCRTFLPWNRH